MELGDIRLLLTVGGMLVSVVSAFVIVKQRVAGLDAALDDIEARLRVLDKRVDKSELTDQRVDILATILSPERRQVLFERIAKIEATYEERMKAAESEIDHLRSMHNHRHPVVKE